MRFTVTVANFGTATAKDIAIDTQVPPNTTLGEVDCVAFLPPPTYQCVSVIPYAPPHPVTLSINSIKPGAAASRWFPVTVVSMPPDATVKNSATASAQNHPAVVHSNTVVVEVTPP